VKDLQRHKEEKPGGRERGSTGEVEKRAQELTTKNSPVCCDPKDLKQTGGGMVREVELSSQTSEGIREEISSLGENGQSRFGEASGTSTIGKW